MATINKEVFTIPVRLDTLSRNLQGDGGLLGVSDADNTKWYINNPFGEVVYANIGDSAAGETLDLDEPAGVWYSNFDEFINLPGNPDGSRTARRVVEHEDPLINGGIMALNIRQGTYVIQSWEFQPRSVVRAGIYTILIGGLRVGQQGGGAAPEIAEVTFTVTVPDPTVVIPPHEIISIKTTNAETFFSLYTQHEEYETVRVGRTITSVK